jgi:phenylalanine-4-hydroxylase
MSLTTNQAPFIEEARQRGELYVRQPYELYSEANHEAWRRLYARMGEYWQRYANPHFLQGITSLCLNPERVPNLDDVNRFLCPLTGFRAKAVSGYIPAFQFFNCLRDREFPTTITVRDPDHLDYLPEPDIFHDIAGHVPMHTDPAFADALVRFGDCAHTAVEIVQTIADEDEKVRRLTSIIRAMARFFWFTIEFGLMEGPKIEEVKIEEVKLEGPKIEEAKGSGQNLKAYGSGLLSSHGELEHSIESQYVQRFPLQLEWVINQGFEIDHYQPLLFVVRDFAHLFELVDQLEAWMRAGKLNNVAPGEPAVSPTDVMSFLHA